MKILYRSRWREHFTEVSVEDFITQAMDGVDFGQGSLEDMQKTTSNISEAFGRLIDTLAFRKVLNAEEVVEIAGGFSDYEEVEFFELKQDAR